MTRHSPRSFLRRLATDTRGNTLAIVGAALVPLTGMIGSGVDISRAYMAKTRLQAACDAGVLAGRRVMTGDTVGKTVRDEATRFFFFNFPKGVYGSNDITLAGGDKPADPLVNRLYVWRSAQGTVAGHANTALPTGVMHLFGFDTMDIAVDCEASHDFNNVDVMLVLDVTGSMGCAASDNVDACGNYASNNTYTKDGQNYVTEKNNSRMDALRDAVIALYEELEPVQQQLEDNNLRLRYGVLPYSSGVNVGELLLDDGAVNILGGASGQSWTYQTRENTRTRENFSGWGDNAEAACRRLEEEIWHAQTKECEYFKPAKRSVNVSGYVNSLKGSTFNAATLIGGGRKDVRWTGCIEERATSSKIDKNSGSDTFGAMDLDIDLVPNGDPDTKWKPYFPRISYLPNVSGFYYPIQTKRPQVACPAPARALDEIDEETLDDYLDTLLPTGGTYHDNGMRWGARMISDAGVFARSPLTFNNRRVEKHIIFMTDGVLDTGPTLYSTYGLEAWDQRVSGSYSSTDDLDGRHNQRFTLMCQQARRLGIDRGGDGITVWVVAFASTLTPQLSACASGEEYASVTTTNDELKAQFRLIGKSIGALRLSK